MAKEKGKITIPLETEKATIAVEAEIPAVLVAEKSVPATTTAQEDIVSAASRAAADRVTESQRKINRTWEFTQAFMGITLIVTVCAALLLKIEIPPEFWILVTVVAQSYFQRTNHTRIGGVGYKPIDETR